MTHSSIFQFRQYVNDAVLDQVAIQYANETHTYSELLSAIDARASDLSIFVKPGEIVGIQRPRSAEYVIDLLATMTIGAVAMPLDPSLPQARRDAMIEQVPPQAIISETGTITKMSGELGLIPGNSMGHQPAYIMFTSGSTGRPKAILGAMQSLLHFITWQGGEFNVTLDDRVSCLTPIGFDVSLRDIFLPLLHGATLFIPSQTDLKTPDAIVDWMVNNRITLTHAVPSVARLWSQTGRATGNAITRFFLAGEKLYNPAVSELRNAFGQGVEFINLYGPSETTLAKFFHRVGSTPDLSETKIPVGKALPDTEFHFLGGKAKGEVVISTRFASLGYLGASVQENDRFTKTVAGRVQYRTGDVGEINDNGDLVIVGRTDDEVKINGVRVHPNEITQVLSNTPCVQDLITLSVEAPGGQGPRLAAFWVAQPSAASMPDAAPRNYALERLPQAIVPTIWKRLDHFPKNANGKIDRQKLQQLLLINTEPQSEQAKTPTETWVLKSVSEILSQPVENPNADLFGLGATSIHIAFLIGKIEEQLAKSLEFADVFATPRLRDIATLIDRAKAVGDIDIPRIERKSEYELSPQQRRWWNIYMPKGNRSWATMVRVLRFKVSVTPQMLRNGLVALGQAQDSLQVYFQPTADGIRMRRIDVLCDTPFPIGTHDFSGQTSQDAEIALDRLRLGVANQEIATDTWPLFRAHIAQMPDGRSAIVFAMHHMISDGYSIALIEKQLRDFLENGTAFPVPTSFNYLDYADWAINAEKKSYGPGSDAQAYWGKVFDTHYKKHIFKEKWTGPEHDRGQGYCIQIPVPLRSQIKEFARANKVTEFSVYFAAKFMVLHDMLDRNDLVIGTPAAGREVKGVEGIIGNFISLVSIRSKDFTDKDPLGFVRQTMHSVAHAMTNQNYQFDTIVKQLGMEFEQSRFPLTTMFISYLNFGGSGSFNPADAGFTDLGFAVKFDLMSYVREHDDATSLAVQYRNNLFDKHEIATFCDKWIAKLSQIMETQVIQFPAVEPAEIDKPKVLQAS